MKFEIDLKKPVREMAKYWFRRKPYAAFDLRRSDAGGQANIESVSSTIARDTEIEKRYIEVGKTVGRGSNGSRQSDEVE